MNTITIGKTVYPIVSTEDTGKLTKEQIGIDKLHLVTKGNGSQTFVIKQLMNGQYAKPIKF